LCEEKLGKGEGILEVSLNVEVVIQVGFCHADFVSRQKHPPKSPRVSQDKREAGRLVAGRSPGGAIP
jgi:hypothetical protein